MRNARVTVRLPRLTPGGILRLLTGATVAVAAAPVVGFALQSMVAAWLVFPPPVLNPSPPSAADSDTQVMMLRQAASWSPGEATYPFMSAQVHQQRMGARWLDRSATLEGELAAEAAARALTRLRPNPFYSRLVGSVAIDRARHPATGPEASRELVDEALAHMRDALQRGPSSPLLYQQVGLDLLKAWSHLQDAGRATAIGVLRDAVSWHEGLLDETLATIWGHFPGADSLPLLDAVTPERASAYSRLADFLEYQAEQMSPTNPERRLVASRALEAHRTAVEISGLRLAYVEPWVSAYPRLSENPRQFLEEARQLVLRHPDQPESHLALAAAAGSAGDRGEQVQAAERAVSLARDRFLGVLEDLGYEVHLEAGIQPLRAAVIDLLERDTPRSRAGVPASREEVEEARDLYATTLETHADLMRRGGSHEQAAEAYRRLSALYPTQARPLIELGRSLDAMGRQDDALESYRDAVRIQPRSNGPRRVLARALAERREYLAAIDQWRTVLSREPRAIDAQMEIARTLTRMGLLADAVREYSDILERDPDNRTAREEMDQVLQRMQGR